MNDDVPEVSPEQLNEWVDPEHHHVPVDLLELHVELEAAGVSPEDFKEVFGEASNSS